MSSKVDWAQARFWMAALLGSALWLGACAEELPAAPVKGGDKSPASSDDSDEDENADDDSAATDDDDESKPTVKIDAGTPKPKPDAAALDAKTPTDTKKPDAGAEPIDVPTDASTTSTSGDGGKEGSGAHADLGKGDGKDVIAIGDSWMNYALNGGGIQRGLLAASMQKYRTYGVTGVELLMANGFGPAIPTQYDNAKRANPDIKTVVMTGGGNDLLMLAAGDAKKKIDEVGARLDSLWKQMATDGVKDVLYIEYSEGGNNAENVKYGISKVQPICEGQTGLRCHFMLSDPIIMKTLIDGIHPTSDGCTKLGKAAFDLMVSEGMRR